MRDADVGRSHYSGGIVVVIWPLPRVNRSNVLRRIGDAVLCLFYELPEQEASIHKYKTKL